MLWDKNRMTPISNLLQKTMIWTDCFCCKNECKATTQSHNNMTGKYLRNSLLPIAVVETDELGKALSSALPNPGNQSKRNVRLGKENTRFIETWGISCLFWFWSSLSFFPTAPRDWDYRFPSKAVIQEWSQSSDHAPPKLHGKVGASDSIFPECIRCCTYQPPVLGEPIPRPARCQALREASVHCKDKKSFFTCKKSCPFALTAELISAQGSLHPLTKP